MALITIPTGVSRVVLEGTTGTVLANGPGHFRSSVFPGGAGDERHLGRAAAYGGPFGRIGELHNGARHHGHHPGGDVDFRVIDVRPAGAKVRPVRPGTARLTLGTAAGRLRPPPG